MEEIKLNLENLSEQEREQLLKLVEKANKPKAGRWKPKKYDRYWFVSLLAVTGVTETNWTGDLDNVRFSVGNVFKTEEEAQFTLEKRKVEVELQDAADELNDGWVPDWNNIDNYKHYIQYDCRIEEFVIGCSAICKSVHIYFKSEQCANEAIKRIGEERLKKYYFEVE